VKKQLALDKLKSEARLEAYPELADVLRSRMASSLSAEGQEASSVDPAGSPSQGTDSILAIPPEKLFQSLSDGKGLFSLGRDPSEDPAESSDEDDEEDDHRDDGSNPYYLAPPEPLPARKPRKNPAKGSGGDFRERKRQRNRESAQLCRERKKKYVSDLEETMEKLNILNGVLARDVASLREENRKLLTEIARAKSGGPIPAQLPSAPHLSGRAPLVMKMEASGVKVEPSPAVNIRASASMTASVGTPVAVPSLAIPSSFVFSPPPQIQQPNVNPSSVMGVPSRMNMFPSMNAFPSMEWLQTPTVERDPIADMMLA